MFTTNNGHVDQILIVTVPQGMDTPEQFKEQMENYFYPLINQYLPFALAIVAVTLLIKKV